LHDRSSENSSDLSSTEDVIQEVLNDYKKTIKDDSLIYLIQCTSPFLYYKDILNSLKIINEGVNINSLFSGYIFNKFIWEKSDDEGILHPINYVPLNRPRTQDKKPLIVENGAFYVFGKSNFDNTRCRLHGNMQSYLMDEIRSVDIDNEDDLIFAENLSKFI